MTLVEMKKIAHRLAMKRYRQKPETKEKIKLWQREYRKHNKDKRREYGKKYNNVRYPKYRIMLHNLKINGCAVCGYNKCDAALEFHHANPNDKSFHIILCAMAYGDKRIIDELNKCILLCANCHREIHNEGRNKENGEKEK